MGRPSRTYEFLDTFSQDCRPGLSLHVPCGTWHPSFQLGVFGDFDGQGGSLLLLARGAALFGAEGASAEVAALFDVEASWKRRKHSRLPRELLSAVQNDFGSIVVLLDFSTNFDHLAGELAHVADVL